MSDTVYGLVDGVPTGMTKDQCIAQLENQLAEARAEIERLNKQLNEPVKLSEWQELEAELEATVTECMAAKSNEDILKAENTKLREAAVVVVEAKRGHFNLPYSVSSAIDNLADKLLEGKQDAL